MAGDVAEEISSANGKIKEECSVGTSSCHDLPNGGSVDCNGVKLEAAVEGAENGNGEEGADKTYVFVNGSDTIAERGDNDENCTEVALAEEHMKNYAELKFNGETKAGEAEVNGCNGHCYFEDVVVVGDGAVEVENGRGVSDENGDCGTEKNSILNFESESDKQSPVEELDGVYSAESEALVVANCGGKIKVESFEVVERASESQEDRLDDKGYIDCKEPSGNTEELSEPVDSTSEIVEGVPESQAVNDEETAGLTDCKGTEDNTAELSEKVECISEFVMVDSKFHRDADGRHDTEESSKVTEQLTPHVESNSEIVEVVPNFQSVSHVDANCSFEEHTVDQPRQVESTSDVVDEICKSQDVSHIVAEVMGDGKGLSGNMVEITAELSEQVGENQKPEVVFTDTAASEVSIGDNEEQVAEESKLCSFTEEKVEESSQLRPNADLLENQESMEIDADDANNDVKQENKVEVATESTIDHLRIIDGDHDQTTKPSVCPEPSDVDTATSESRIKNDHSWETAPVPNPVSAAQEDGDSVDASLDMKKQEAALGSDEILAASADCSNMPVESADFLPTAEETAGALDADVQERYLPVADDISCQALDDREPAAELAVVNDAKEPVLEDEAGNAEVTSSADVETGNEAQDGSAVADDISATHCTTITETKICFGSINHAELSSISIEGRSFEAKSADATDCQLSPDSKSPENDGNDKSMAEGAEVVDVIPQSDEASREKGSSAVVAEAQPVVPGLEKRLFNYLVRVPRYGEDLKEQINEAQAQVDEKTRSRDAIQAEIQMFKATRRGCLVELEAASADERFARESLKSKWQETDNLQSIVKKVKDAMSIDDVDNRIHSMEHRIEHETLPLKEEKQFLREIKQLKQLREQLSSNLGKQEELKEALEHKEQTEERLKALRKEAELLRGNVSRAEVVSKAVRKKFYDGNDKLRELQDQFKAADAVRQEAYHQLTSLRAQLREKNRYFYKYKNDAAISSDLGSKGEQDGVSRICLKQVEEFMELWNNNVEFRREYIRCRSRGTLKRLGTKDGRSLGVDEQPPAITPYPSERVVKDRPTPAFPSLEQAETPSPPAEAVPSIDNVRVDPVKQKKQNSKAKAPAKPSKASVLASSVFVSDFEVAEVTEEPKQTKEEEEKARKEEELRKQEEAARLKEQRRLEEKAKAEAALERKKRNTEKALARAAAKAQKEAEQKEKEREKRLKKKERKKVAGSAPADDVSEEEITPSSLTPTETPKELETKEKVESAAKRPQKPTHFTKQTKVKSTIPPPLRNRGKRKMQLWMWVILVAAVVLALFLAGNSSKSLGR